MKIPVTDSIQNKIQIPVGDAELDGELVVPENATSLVIFSHGSGSSRFSPRNSMVAKMLQRKGIATLLFDLLTSKEDAVYANRFDIGLLTRRLITATGWVMEQNGVEKFHIGYFGASTGAASALNACAKLSNIIKAVVSRGGRPDLSMSFLDQVKAPVLLIVGELDEQVLELNRKAYDRLSCEKELAIIPQATHLFEEPGKLEEVARISAEWFEKKLEK